MTKRKQIGFWITAVVVLIALAVGIFALVTDGFKALGAENHLHHDHADAETDYTVYDGAGKGLESGKVYPLSHNMIFSAPSNASPSGDGVTLQATIVPDTAQNKLVDWNLSWVNPSSSWATGKADCKG